MPDFPALLQQGTANAWLFIPSAILLGALHGLEPGHSKTMMAAFIIAVRGTLTQAILLGLAATVSHTLIVWIIALSGMYFGQQWNVEANEPYLQLVSAAIIICIAFWMIWRTWQTQHAHHAHHPHAHSHDDNMKQIDTGHGVIQISIFEENTPPHFRLLSVDQGISLIANEVTIEIERANHQREVFTFTQREGYLQSSQSIAEPHQFVATLHIKVHDHPHHYAVQFSEHSHHAHEIDEEYQDAHELAHANDIRQRFTNRDVTTGQIIVFGLTGGLIPCPASITVLLLCLQLKKIVLGATLVLCFSIGLAMTMVLSGVLAALSVKHLASNWQGFGHFARKAPYFSGLLIALVGLYVGFQGLNTLGFI